ncbi:hypothetical protein MissD_0034 [Streptococcus phage MissD]|nr:hypothetical protein MissD_0034 [Streptococcus phage MissD]
MKKYIKENQVYTVQEGSELEVQLMADGFEELVEEGSELEVQLMADGFEELVEDGGELETPKETKDKGKE